MKRLVLLFVWTAIFCGGCSSINTLTANKDQGWWRGELSSSTGVVGNQWPDREEDYFIVGSVDYEWPVHDRITLAARGYPLFFYKLQGSESKRHDRIYGAGLGAAVRFYSNSIRKKGFYGEIGSTVLWHDNHMPGNGSSVNFLSNLGLGYDFGNNWAATVKIFHLSNAGLDDANAGFDGLTLGFSRVF